MRDNERKRQVAPKQRDEIFLARYQSGASNRRYTARHTWFYTFLMAIQALIVSHFSCHAWLQPYHRKRTRLHTSRSSANAPSLFVQMAYTNGETMTSGGERIDRREAPKLPSESEDLRSSINGETKDDESAQSKTLVRTDSEDQPLDYIGAGTLGDIMSVEDNDDEDESRRNETISESAPLRKAKSSPTSSGLVTLDGETLEARFGITSRLDRMATTANGNLQRLVSSYYDAPVHVVVDKCILRSGKTWDRVVHLTVHNQTFCTATSEIIVHDTTCRSLVQSGQVGLGQLFRHLNRLPTFILMDAGLSQEGALWRQYQLSCDELECRVHEVFVPDVWEIEPESSG